VTEETEAPQVPIPAQEEAALVAVERTRAWVADRYGDALTGKQVKEIAVGAFELIAPPVKTAVVADFIGNLAENPLVDPAIVNALRALSEQYRKEVSK
jgi:hypothetical protein